MEKHTEKDCKNCGKLLQDGLKFFFEKCSLLADIYFIYKDINSKIFSLFEQKIILVFEGDEDLDMSMKKDIFDTGWMNLKKMSTIPNRINNFENILFKNKYNEKFIDKYLKIFLDNNHLVKDKPTSIENKSS